MELNFYSCGAGKPFIILHGLLGSSDNWQTLSKRFAEHFQVFAVDLRNHGKSPHDDVIDYPSMAADLDAFVSAHQLNEPILLGHSMGGKVGMQFAGTFPARLEKLIVADIAPKSYPDYHTEILDALGGLDLPKFSSRTEIDAALAPKIPEAPLRQFLLKNVTREANGPFQWKINLPAIRTNYPKITENVVIEKPFDRPTLFIRGENSDYITDEDEPVIRKNFPKAEIVTIQSAGHWLHAEKPDEFFRLTMDFCKKT